MLDGGACLTIVTDLYQNAGFRPTEYTIELILLALAKTKDLEEINNVMTFMTSRNIRLSNKRYEDLTMQSIRDDNFSAAVTFSKQIPVEECSLNLVHELAKCAVKSAKMEDFCTRVLKRYDTEKKLALVAVLMKFFMRDDGGGSNKSAEVKRNFTNFDTVRELVEDKFVNSVGEKFGEYFGYSARRKLLQ